MFSESTVVIAAHSSVLSFLPFFMPGTSVIEFPTSPARTAFMDLAVSLQLHHHSVEAPSRPVTGIYESLEEGSSSVLQRTVTRVVKSRRKMEKKEGMMRHEEL
eukprot:TRINITY_DN11024_c0_g1_i1.p1 TRINITY_DN11024_c0_g1~~TRINITY_DN11024_c0_g1_i1.p1  ORF type:complete len:103 (-),score=9.65 TRINITY_DN11024_c0_g1_i1:170-478(-)